MKALWALPVLLGLQSVVAAAPRPLSLQEAVDIGLRADPQLAQSRIAQDRAKLAVLRAKLDHVSLKIDGQLQELFSKSNIGGPTAYNCVLAGISFATDPSTCMGMGGMSSVAAVQQPQQGLGTFNLAANLNVPIFSGLRIESNVKRAQRLEDASAASTRQTRKDIALSVARAYWSVRRLGLLLEVQQRTVARLQEAETIADGRVRAGLAPPVDKNRATLKRLQQVAAVAEQLGSMRESAVQLAVALGLQEDVMPTDMPSVPSLPLPTWQQLVDDARGLRPELKLARAQTEAQRQQVKVVQSGFYPQLNALMLFQLGNNQFNPISGVRGLSDSANPFANISGNFTAGLTLSMNFFDMLNTWTAQKDAKYEEARLLEDERRVRRIVDGDVRAAHAKLERLYGRRAALIEAGLVAADNLKIIESRYKNGDSLVIEYLDGQTELAQTELDLADNTAQLQLAWLELAASLGKIVGMEPQL